FPLLHLASQPLERLLLRPPPVPPLAVEDELPDVGVLLPEELRDGADPAVVLGVVAVQDRFEEHPLELLAVGDPQLPHHLVVKRAIQNPAPELCLIRRQTLRIPYP